MKKNYFFIAALAIGMMSSCSSDDVLEEPMVTPENPDEVVDEGTTRMAIELGISDPSFSVSTRGTGTVGDIDGATGNLWNGQPLGIFMVNRNTMTEATEGEGTNATPIFNGMTFKAPVNTAAGNIIMYHDVENVKYYPLTGAYDFYGYHLGETDAPASVTYWASENVVADADNAATFATISATIDGTQDIMAGKAELTNDQKTTLGTDYTSRAYSSWSARRGIIPSISFKHMLSRLVFNVKAGEPKAASESYVDSYDPTVPNTFPKVDDGTGTNTKIDQAVYITAITVKDQADNVLLTFTPGSDVTPADIALKDISEATGDGRLDYILKERDEATTPSPGDNGDGNINLSTLAELVTLNPTCPIKADGTAKQVGESMMIFPGQGSFVVDIKVEQYVQIYDDPEVAGSSINDKYAWKTQNMTTTVNAPVSTEDNNAFAQGKSYNINVTVYGYQRIEVEAVLEGWIAGDDVEVNPEDDAFNQ